MARREHEQHLIWERPEPKQPAALRSLSRERIVRASVAIADKEGLAAVSFRRVGDALKVGPMRLYSHVSTKEELLDLIVDAVYEELGSEGAVPRQWRQAVRTIAQRTRQAGLRHPWFMELMGGRPHRGPHALVYLEAVLGALKRAPGLKTIDGVLQAAKAVNAYVIGAIRSEAAERHAQQESGMSKAEWQDASGPYMLRMIATGRFPVLAEVVEEARHPSADAEFEQGLELVLDGIEAQSGA